MPLCKCDERFLRDRLLASASEPWQSMGGTYTARLNCVYGAVRGWVVVARKEGDPTGRVA